MVRGRPKFEPKTANTVVISFKASEQLREQLRKYAAANHKRPGEVIRAAIVSYITPDKSRE